MSILSEGVFVRGECECADTVNIEGDALRA